MKQTDMPPFLQSERLQISVPTVMFFFLPVRKICDIEHCFKTLGVEKNKNRQVHDGEHKRHANDPRNITERTPIYDRTLDRLKSPSWCSSSIVN